MPQPRRRASILVLGTLIAVVAWSACGRARKTKAGASPSSDVAVVLKRQTQELMDAVAPGNAEVWQRYVLDGVVYVDENGDVVYDKASLLKDFTPLPAGLVGRIVVDRFQVKVHGDTAVAAAEIQEYLEYHGQQLRTRFRFLDTWIRTPDGWRLAARHTAAVLKDPPAISLSAEELCAYAGDYRLTPAITTTVRCTKNGLIAERSDRPPATYLPEVRDVFFVAGRPRSRRIFTRDAAGAVAGFVDRREGEDVRWVKIR